MLNHIVEMSGKELPVTPTAQNRHIPVPHPLLAAMQPLALLRGDHSEKEVSRDDDLTGARLQLVCEPVIPPSPLIKDAISREFTTLRPGEQVCARALSCGVVTKPVRACFLEPCGRRDDRVARTSLPFLASACAIELALPRSPTYVLFGVTQANPGPAHSATQLRASRPCSVQVWISRREEFPLPSETRIEVPCPSQSLQKGSCISCTCPVSDRFQYRRLRTWKHTDSHNLGRLSGYDPGCPRRFVQYRIGIHADLDPERKVFISI